jgi:hypothetical protein
VDSKAKIDEMLRRKRESVETDQHRATAEPISRPIGEPIREHGSETAQGEHHASQLEKINAMLKQKLSAPGVKEAQPAQVQPALIRAAEPPAPPVPTVPVAPVAKLQEVDLIEAALNEGNAAFYYGGFIGSKDKDKRTRGRRRR